MIDLVLSQKISNRSVKFEDIYVEYEKWNLPLLLDLATYVECYLYLKYLYYNFIAIPNKQCIPF